MMLTSVRALWHPEVYHGAPRRGRAFEGWYFKLANADQTRALAVIPGIYNSPDSSEAHSFVQFYDAARGGSVYHRYPAAAFGAAKDRFEVTIGPNRFTRDSLTLDLDQGGQRVQGVVRIGGGPGWPVRLLSPGVMGPLAFLPNLECCHGVLAFDCALSGGFHIDRVPMSLEGGRGYLEKDWGRSFPRGWVWMQSNHFESPGVSLVLSVARVPWLGAVFRGFFAGLLLQGQLYKFTTYGGDRLNRLILSDEHVDIELSSSRYAPRRPRLVVSARRSAGAELLHPSSAGMVDRLVESLTAELSVRLSETVGGREDVIYQGVGHWAGLEIGGSAAELVTG